MGHHSFKDLHNSSSGGGANHLTSVANFADHSLVIVQKKFDSDPNSFEYEKVDYSFTSTKFFKDVIRPGL
jgi:hypothetical protein